MSVLVPHSHRPPTVPTIPTPSPSPFPGCSSLLSPFLPQQFHNPFMSESAQKQLTSIQAAGELGFLWDREPAALEAEHGAHNAKGTIREIVLPKGLDLDRPKRTRTSFTAEQLYRLELEFQRCQYVVGRERTELARQLNLSETQVKVWFQNRRTKQKKDQNRDAEKRSATTSESFATCSLLRLLEQSRLLPGPAPPGLLSPPSHPIASPAGLPTPGPASPGLSGRSSPGAFSLQLPVLASSSSSSPSSPSPRLPSSVLGFGPSMLGGPHDPPGPCGLSSSAFEPYTRVGRKDNGRGSAEQSP
uniref:Uncharacterized protein n=1 Tax=Melopsittacus undulatus TaxID=13146 RepID=A0A8V5GAG0_MELUD